MKVAKTLKEKEGLEHRYFGLSKKEAKRRLEKYGDNTIVQKKKTSAIKIFLSQFGNFMVIILLVSTLISAFMGEVTEAVTIIAIVIINALFGFLQEFRTEKTIEALKSLAAPTAKVIRDGKLEVIAAREVVKGDLILLENGDRVPADANLIEANNLQVDESLLTGESVPVSKTAVHPASVSIKSEKEMRDKVFMGTTVTSGRGKAVVYATGMDTEMGKIAHMIQNIEEEQTPLQKRLAHLGKFIVYGCLLVCAVVSVTGIIRGESVFNMLLSGISLAVAAVPEGLPAIVTVALALGVQKMLKRNALIRKLPAVETLGCATVICSDKTGTLTQNKMTVRKIYTANKIIEVEDDKEQQRNVFICEGISLEPQKDHALRLILETGSICNNAKLKITSGIVNTAIQRKKAFLQKKTNWEITGDPTEGALLVAAAKAGINIDELTEMYTRIDEIPFDSERKCMTVVCKDCNGETFVFTKGAPDVVIKKCSKIYTSKGVMDLNADTAFKIMKINDGFARQSLRVLGFAYKKLEGSLFSQSSIESDLIFVGLMGMLDPPRKEAKDAVRICKMAGIKPVMITGDHKITASAIAKELNILAEGDEVLTGEQIDRLSEHELAKKVEKVSVYARVSPKHKLTIVRALKKNGHVVAMTGDGVNDAPAVKEADIGISMGITGTDVTKEASSMILLDDNFATIVAAVEEGRVIYNNIRKFIRYMLSCNLGEVLTMFLGILFGLPIPLLPIQVLWVNLVTDGLPAVTLGLDPPEKNIMARPPRGVKEHIFSHGLLELILLRGTLIGLCTLAAFTSVLYFSADVSLARTAAFATLVLTQLIHVFECKSEKKNIFEIPLLNNMALVFSVILSLIMTIGVIYIKPLQTVFDTVSLSLNDWMIITGFSAIGPVLSSFFRGYRK